MCVCMKERGKCFHNTSHEKEGAQIGCSIELNPSCSTLSVVKKLLFSLFSKAFCSEVDLSDPSLFISTCQMLG